MSSFICVRCTTRKPESELRNNNMCIDCVIDYHNRVSMILMNEAIEDSLYGENDDGA